MDKKLLKTEEELKILREGGKIFILIMKQLKSATTIGTSTKKLDQLVDTLCHEYKVIAGTKGYRGFPASFCPCVNDTVVHGIPSEKVVLRDGDIITLDLVIKHKGLYVDGAITVALGHVPLPTLQFLETVKRARDLAIHKVKPGRYIGDLSSIMEYTVRQKGYSPVREMTGHGIGYSMHEEPIIPCLGEPGTGIKIQAGMVLAIEAIIAYGKPEIVISKSDGWTAKTKDCSIAAVFEHTIIVEKNGYTIIT